MDPAHTLSFLCFKRAKINKAIIEMFNDSAIERTPMKNQPNTKINLLTRKGIYLSLLSATLFSQASYGSDDLRDILLSEKKEKHATGAGAGTGGSVYSTMSQARREDEEIGATLDLNNQSIDALLLLKFSTRQLH
jgi:hypothetical protein